MAALKLILYAIPWLFSKVTAQITVTEPGKEYTLNHNVQNTGFIVPVIHQEFRMKFKLKTGGAAAGGHRDYYFYIGSYTVHNAGSNFHLSPPSGAVSGVASQFKFSIFHEYSFYIKKCGTKYTYAQLLNRKEFSTAEKDKEETGQMNVQFQIGKKNSYQHSQHYSVQVKDFEIFGLEHFTFPKLFYEAGKIAHVHFTMQTSATIGDTYTLFQLDAPADPLVYNGTSSLGRVIYPFEKSGENMIITQYNEKGFVQAIERNFTEEKLYKEMFDLQLMVGDTKEPSGWGGLMHAAVNHSLVQFISYSTASDGSVKKKCDIIISESAWRIKNNTGTVDVLLDTIQPCNADLRNVEYFFYHDITMTPVDLELITGCQKPDEFVRNENYVKVMYDRKYIFTKACFKIKYSLRPQYVGTGLISSSLVTRQNLTYLDDDVEKAKEFKHILKSHHEDFPGYVIFNEEIHGCVVLDNGVLSSTKNTFENCLKFKEFSSSLTVNGQCVARVAKDIKLITCNMSDLFDHVVWDGNTLTNRDRTFHVDKTMKDKAIAGDVYAGFSAIYEVPDDTKVQPLKVVQTDFAIVDTVVLEDTNRFFFCSYMKNHASRGCYEYNLKSSGVAKLNNVFHLIGHQGNVLYGLDENSQIVKKSRGKIQAIKKDVVDTAMGQPDFVQSKTFSRADLFSANVSNVMQVEGVSYSVTYYGIYRDDLKAHAIVWLPETDCETKVAKVSHLSLSSCDEVKSYCKKAQSGQYYIHGKGATKHLVQENCSF